MLFQQFIEFIGDPEQWSWGCFADVTNQGYNMYIIQSKI